MNSLLITQARTGSTRLPGKVLKTINGNTLLKIHLQRLSKCTLIDQILVATTDLPQDEIIKDHVFQLGFASFAGSEQDVLDRFYKGAKLYSPTWVVRVTADCPLIDPQLVDEVLSYAVQMDADYCSNTLIEHFPDGQDVEVFKFTALEKAWNEAIKLSEREHVTPFIRANSSAKGGHLFNAINFPCDADFSHIRMTVDEPRDFDLIEQLVSSLGVERSWVEYANFIINNDLLKVNANIVRNEGLLKSISKDK